jgi:HlyD family secretion protein
MSRLVKVIVLVLMLAAAASALAVWYTGRSDGGGQYRTAAVRRTDIVQTITATGTVVPEDVIDVGAQVNGQIATFGTDADGKTIDYRSTVNEGMLLARIDDSLFAADVATSQAELAQSQAQVKVANANRDQAKAKLDQTTRDWERAQQLGGSAALAQVDYDAARSAYEQAEASLAVAEASISQANASVDMAQASVLRAKRNLTYCTINSPVSGVIIDKRVEIGQTVVASLNAPSLFLIAKDLSRMQVLVQVNEADIGSVHPGQAVNFTVDAFPSETFRGEVRKVRLNATMTQNVVTYTVEIVTDNKDLRLLPYLTANVRFVVAKREQVLAVPNAALRWSPRQSASPPVSAPASRPSASDRGAGRAAPDRGDGPTVWLLVDGRPQSVAVQTGLSDGTLTEVQSSGLAEDAQVIVGEEVARTTTPPTGASPFTPQMPGRRGPR